jgi:hypothetical protein
MTLSGRDHASECVISIYRPRQAYAMKTATDYAFETDLKRRDSRTPCSSTSPEIVGFGAYQLRCNVDLPGADLVTSSDDNFSDCLDTCTKTKSCVGVTWDGHCFLKNIVTQPQSRGYVVDSAILLPTDVQDDCAQLDSQLVIKGTRFKTYCGMDYPQDDIMVKYHANSMGDCMGICVDQKVACVGVSYEAAMTHAWGYWNCYLKSATAVNGLRNQTHRTDSAFVVDNSNLPAPSSAPGPMNTQSSISTSSTGGPTSSSEATASRKSSSKLVGGTIAGIVVGSLIGVALTVIMCIVLYKRHRRALQTRLSPNNQHSDNEELSTRKMVYEPEIHEAYPGRQSPSELSGRRAPVELSGSQVSELRAH